MTILDKIGLEQDQIRIFLSAVAAVCGFGLISYAGLPIMVGATMENLALSEADVGLLYTLEFLAAALSSIIIAPCTGKINRRNIALSGALIAILGNVLSALWCSYETLLVFRALTGLGAGLVLACGNATLSNARHPARMSGLLNVFFAGLLLILMILLPALENSWALPGVFMGLTGIMLFLVPLISLMPEYAISTNTVTVVTENSTSDGILSGAGIAIFIVFFLFTLRDNMAWSFAERIGVEVDYTTAEVGTLLSIQGVLGLLGPIVATIIGFKMGVKFPVIFGIIFAGLTTFGVFLSVSIPSLFIMSLMCWTAAYFYAIAYLTAYAATLDQDGRIVAAAGSAMVLGVAAGPAISGYLITYGGYTISAWVTAGLVAIMVVAILFTFSMAKKKQQSQIALPAE